MKTTKTTRVRPFVSVAPFLLCSRYLRTLRALHARNDLIPFAPTETEVRLKADTA